MVSGIAELKYQLERTLKEVEASSASNKRDGRVLKGFSILRSFHLLAQSLYASRARTKQSTELSEVEDLMSHATHQILSYCQFARKGRPYLEWKQRYREIWVRELSLFIFVLCFFVGGLLLGWNLGVGHPDFVAMIVPQQMMEMVLDNKAWFEEIQQSPVIWSMQIGLNNILVSAKCFVFGALLGIGGIGLMLFNAILFGTLMGYCHIAGFSDELATFVAAHGPLELTIIIASAFASLVFGRVFYMRPLRAFPKRMAKAGRDSGIIMAGILPWLVLAASLECFVSPYQYLSMQQKIALGFSTMAIFWIWTFRPLPKRDDL